MSRRVLSAAAGRPAAAFAVLFLFGIVALAASPSLAQTPIDYGETLSGELTVVGEIDEYSFSGTAGEVVILRLAELSAVLEPRLRLLNPSGVEIASTYGYSLAELDEVSLPTTGVYKVTVSDNGADETGSYSLHVQCITVPAGATAIVLGQIHSGTVAAAAATRAFTFSVADEHRYLLRICRLASSFYPQVRLYAPSGERLVLANGNPLVEIDPFAPPADGTYTVLVMDNSGLLTSEFRLHAQCLDEPVDTTTIAYGQTLTGSLADLTDTAVYRFTAGAGDRILVRLAETTAILEPEFRLYDPDGGEVTRVYGYSLAELDAYALPAAGTYTLLVDDYTGEDTGNFALHLQRTRQAAGAVALGFGETLPATLGQYAETAAFTVAAAVGDRVLLRLARTAPGLYPHLHVYDPSGLPVQTAVGNPLAEVDPFEPETTGDYTILVMDNGGQATGGLMLHAQRLNQPLLAVPVDYVTTRTDTLTLPAQTRAYTFTGAAGDSVIARMTELATVLEPQLRLYAADGTRLADIYANAEAVLGHRLTTGAGYTLLAMDQAGDETGAYVFALTAIATAVPDLPGDVTAFAFHGAFPNPFNPRTTFVFDLPADVPVSLVIYGIDGRRVAEVVGGMLPAGRHRVVWNGCDAAGRGVASGSYLGVLQAGNERRTQRLTLVR